MNYPKSFTLFVLQLLCIIASSVAFLTHPNESYGCGGGYSQGSYSSYSQGSYCSTGSYTSSYTKSYTNSYCSTGSYTSSYTKSYTGSYCSTGSYTSSYGGSQSSYNTNPSNTNNPSNTGNSYTQSTYCSGLCGAAKAVAAATNPVSLFQSAKTFVTAAITRAKETLGITPPKTTYTDLSYLPIPNQTPKTIPQNVVPIPKQPTTVNVPDYIQRQIDAQTVTAPRAGTPLTEAQQRVLQIARQAGMDVDSNPAAEATALLAAKGKTPDEFRAALDGIKTKTGGDLNQASKILGLGITSGTNSGLAAQELRIMSGLANPGDYSVAITKQMTVVDDKRVAANSDNNGAQGIPKSNEQLAEEATRRVTSASLAAEKEREKTYFDSIPTAKELEEEKQKITDEKKKEILDTTYLGEIPTQEKINEANIKLKNEAIASLKEKKDIETELERRKVEGDPKFYSTSINPTIEASRTVWLEDRLAKLNQQLPSLKYLAEKVDEKNTDLSYLPINPSIEKQKAEAAKTEVETPFTTEWSNPANYLGRGLRPEDENARIAEGLMIRGAGTAIFDQEYNPKFAKDIMTAIWDAEKKTGVFQKDLVKGFVRSRETQAQYYANAQNKPYTYDGVTYQPQAPGTLEPIKYKKDGSIDYGVAAEPGNSRHELGAAIDLKPGPIQDYITANIKDYPGLRKPESLAKSDPDHIQSSDKNYKNVISVNLAGSGRPTPVVNGGPSVPASTLTKNNPISKTPVTNNTQTATQARLGNDVSGPSTNVPQVSLTKLAALSKGKYDIDSIVTPDVAKKIAINNIPVLTRDQFAKDVENLTPSQQKIAGIFANQAAVQGLSVGVALGMGATENRFSNGPHKVKDKNGNLVDSQYQGPAQIGTPEFNAYASEAAKALGKQDIYANIQAGTAYMKDLETDLKKMGVSNPTAGDVYLSYNQGLDGYRVLKENPNMSAVQALQLTKEHISAAEAQRRVSGNASGLPRGASAAEFAKVISDYPTVKYAGLTKGSLPTGDNPGGSVIPTPDDKIVTANIRGLGGLLQPKSTDNALVKGLKEVANGSPTVRAVLGGLTWLQDKIGGGGGTRNSQVTNSGNGGSSNGGQDSNSSRTKNDIASTNFENQGKIVNAKNRTTNQNADAIFRALSDETTKGITVTNSTEVLEGVTSRIKKTSFSVENTQYNVEFKVPISTTDGLINTIRKNEGTLSVKATRSDVGAAIEFNYIDMGVDGILDKLSINNVALDSLVGSSDIAKRYKEALEVAAQKYYGELKK